LDVAIGRDGFVRTIASFSAFELVDVLRDQIAFDAVPGDKRQTLLENLELTESRTLIEHC
jgi:hypothetical protein